MSAPFSPGDDVLASDYIESSAGAGDAGRVPYLDGSGLLHQSFLRGALAINGIAGQNIAANDALFVAKNQQARHRYNLTDGTDVASFSNATFWRANIYTTPNIAEKFIIHKVIIKEGRGSGGSGGTNFGQYQIVIRAVDGSDNPTGSNLGASNLLTINTWGDSAVTEKTLTFASPVQLNPNTKYAFIVYYTSTDTDTRLLKGGGTPTDYVAGRQSSDGSSWSNWANAFFMKVDYTFGDYGKLYDTNARFYASSRFAGFARRAYTVGESAYAEKGMATGFSGLTANTRYFLSNTSGLISTTPGTLSIPVGDSVSTTAMYVGNNIRYGASITLDINEPIPLDGIFIAGNNSTTLLDENGATVAASLFYQFPVSSGYSANIAGSVIPLFNTF